MHTFRPHLRDLNAILLCVERGHGATTTNNLFVMWHWFTNLQLTFCMDMCFVFMHFISTVPCVSSCKACQLVKIYFHYFTLFSMQCVCVHFVFAHTLSTSLNCRYKIIKIRMRCNIVSLERWLCSAQVFCDVDHAHAVQTRCMAVRVHRHCVEYVLCGGVQVGAEEKIPSGPTAQACL